MSKKDNILRKITEFYLSSRDFNGLRIENLVKRYPTGDLAIDNVSLEIPRGQVLALIGPSGAGKSTLIRCVNRLVEPTSGKVYLDDLELTRLGSSALRQARTRMGMIFQEYALVERLSVMENVMSRLWKGSGIKRNKIGHNYDISSIRGFRKRFDTVLEMNPEVSMGATQYLMDHTGYLSGKHYRRPTAEQLFESYKKAWIELMINDEYRLELEIKQKDKQLKENESQKDVRIKELEQRAERTEKLLMTLMQKLES